MTISNTVRKAGPYSGNGITTAFPFSFKVFAAADVLVVLTNTSTGVETTQTLTSQYTVSLNPNQDSNPGGTVTMIAAPAAGFTLTIGSQITYSQPMVLTNTGGFYPTVINDALDRATALIQQLLERSARALSLPFSAASGVSTSLPAPVANNLIAWDGTGSGFQNVNPAGIVSLATYGSTVADLFSGTGAQTAFTLSGNPAVVANLDVSVGGSVLRPGLDYTWSGTTITFTTPPAAGTNNILVRYGTTVPAGTATSATTATNLAGGVTGQIPYQSGAGVTAYVGPGTAGQVMLSQGPGQPPMFGTLQGANLQEFSSSGTWTKPANATFVMAELWAAGGGGGSGRRGAAASMIFGGGAGGGGAYGFRLWKASDLPASVSVAIGAGGTGGAAVAADSTNGNQGSPGGDTSFGALMTVYGGSNGGGGTNAAANGGQGGGVLSASAPGTASSADGHFGPGQGEGRPSGYGGGNGGGSSSSNGGSSYQGGAGGGAGGYYNGTNDTAGGAGGGTFGSSGTGPGRVAFPGGSGAAGSDRQGGSGGAVGYSWSNNVKDAAFGNGTFAALTNQGAILTSANGTNNWVFTQSPNGLAIGQIVHDGTQFVLFNSNATRCWTTTNFSTFTERAAPSSAGVTPQSVRFLNGNYFICHNTGLLRSTDLVTWSAVATGLSYVIDICWSGTNYVVVSDAAPLVRYSSNLSSWTTSTGASNAYACAAASGTVVFSSSSGTRIFRSTDHGQTFSASATTLTAYSDRSLSFAGSVFFAATVGGDIWTSSDGSTWTQRATGPVFRGQVAFDGTTFVIANQSNDTDAAWTSTPGGLGTWTARSITARNVAGGAGGAGGSLGGGGGGGGGSNNGQNSGAGGNGGPGFARIYAW